MATFLAWVSTLLIAYQLSLWILNRYTRAKGRNITTSLKLNILKVQKYHKPAGMTLLLAGLLHGYLAQGNRIDINHNGSLIWIFMLFAVVLGMIKENSNNPRLEKAHIQYAFLIIIALVYHYMLPGPLWK